ncbi:MDR family MFS transporter [Paenibacillus macerans]|uniref:MDR family MFS transporter n=1 Tax=Paenibacillus sp. FSL M7-0831 TaxID=2975314 RepID=UPI00068BB76E|nr:MDR family MFS transporter [Paenibacillus macerans]MBS5909076.1 MFS transporter [Paenibacillus macerans]MCY7560536.1 MFS transporter [Paenibacillus macerans]MEC0140717.1 MDR family MFS transporter [Paenibacillus macerans]MEC0153528.1 MDR family MFS transporter [Paenibacillus macerans]MEC0334076.1 MDR family MFS transporter [Paenibacillus macerans]
MTRIVRRKEVLSLKTGLQRNYILLGLLLSTFLAAIEGTVIGPAGPRIVGDLGGAHLLSWVFTAYLLTMTVATPIFGKISDLYGRRPVFVISSLLFLAGSVLSGIAQNMEQLIGFRALQGIGAGGLLPVTFTIIGDIFSIEERAKIQGWISSVWGISSLVGPLLGGYFVDSLNWRWVFYFNIPFGLLSLFFIIKYLRERVEKRKVKIDIAGAITLTIGVGALLIGLATGGQQLPWSSPWMIFILALAACALILFFIVEKKASEPLVPLKLFRVRDIAYSNLASLVASALLIGLTSYLPLWVQGVRGESATASGLILAPMSIGWMLGSVLGSRMIITRGSRLTSLIGMAVVAAGAGGLAFMTEGTPLLPLLLFNALYGIGFGFSFAVFTIIAQSSVGYSLRGASNALNSFVKSIGQTIGVTAFGTLINLQIAAKTKDLAASGIEVSQNDIDQLLSPEKVHLLPRDLWSELKHVLGASLHSLFLVMAVLAVIGVLIVLGLRNRAPGTDEEQGEGAAESPDASGV